MIRNMKQITHNRFLNYFEITAEDRNGRTFPYYMASRAADMQGLFMNSPQKGPDGVAIYSLYGEKKDRVVLIRQFRYPLGGYVYEFPAGLVEAGETPRSAAVREIREETGLTLKLLNPDPMFERPFFMTVGMTDENCSIVFGYCSGQVSTDGLEPSEELQVVLADRDEVRRILREENCAMSCAYMLMHFLQHPDNPFPFSEAE